MSGRTSGGRLRYYDSEQAFIDVGEPLIEGGISEFGLYYPPLPEQIPMMERIASDTIPTLKKKYVSGI